MKRKNNVDIANKTMSERSRVLRAILVCVSISRSASRMTALIPAITIMTCNCSQRLNFTLSRVYCVGLWVFSVGDVHLPVSQGTT